MFVKDDQYFNDIAVESFSIGIHDILNKQTLNAISFSSHRTTGASWRVYINEKIKKREMKFIYIISGEQYGDLDHYPWYRFPTLTIINISFKLFDDN